MSDEAQTQDMAAAAGAANQAAALPPGDQPQTPADAPNAAGGASDAALSAAVTSAPDAPASTAAGEPGNAEASAVAASIAVEAAVQSEPAPAAELPNAGAAAAVVASAEEAPTSVPPASGEAGASSTDANSVGGQVAGDVLAKQQEVAGQQAMQAQTADMLPLRAQVAHHLEAIYTAVANADKPVIDEAVGLKQHIGDVLQSIHNGIDVRTGEMVQKLEALFHKL